MPVPAIRVSNLAKRYRRGLTHATSIRELAGGLVDRLLRRKHDLLPHELADVKGIDGDPDERGCFWALSDVGFDVQPGEALGIIGRNGAGKSTLLKILSRITAPTQGRIEINGRVASLLEVGTGFHPELTGRENVYLNGAILGMTKQEIQRKFDEIVAFAEIERFIDTPVKRYSSGMAVRLGFAVAAHLEPEVLVIDEVLAVGDVAFQKKCLGKMQGATGQGRTVLFVSHNMAAVKKLCPRSIVLVGGRIACRGDTKSCIDRYLNSENAQLAGGTEVAGFLHRESVPEQEFGIAGIEMLDAAGSPSSKCHTWDDFLLRLHYHLPADLPDADIEASFETVDGVRLIACSAWQDVNRRLGLKRGDLSVDLKFQRFPLCAGDYVLVAGLAVRDCRLLCSQRVRFVVEEADVYGSGVPPTSRNRLVVPAYQWTFR
jgi:lipopolysaccharide transport system ATP-binding protein